MKFIQFKVIFFITNLFLISSKSSFNNLNFLSENNETNQTITEKEINQNEDDLDLQLEFELSKKILAFDPNNVLIFKKVLKGMIEGFPLFQNSTLNNSCIQHNKNFTKEMINIFTILSEANFTELTIKDDLLKVVDVIVNKRLIFINEFFECKKLQKNMSGGFEIIKNYLNMTDYYDKMTMNFLGNMKRISKLREKSIKNWGEKNYFAVGKKLGELFRLIFFWDIPESLNLR